MSASNNSVSQENRKSISSKETFPNGDNVLSMFKSRKKPQNGSSLKASSFRRKELGSVGLDTTDQKNDIDPSGLEEDALKRKELQNLLELRHLTKRKPRGLGSLKLNSNIEKNNSPVIDSPFQNEILKPKKEMMEAFTKQTNVMDVDKHMISYIETKIQLLKKKELSGEDTTIESSELKSEELPDHLKLGGKKAVAEGNLILSASMLTAIPEVDLGLECRLKNIEDTEIAKQALIDAQLSKLGKIALASGKSSKASDSNLPKDLNFSIQLPQESKPISDKEAVARFKKRFRRQ